MTNNINRKVMDKNLTLTIDSDWLHYLKDEFDKPYFKDLQQFLNEELKQGTTILPEQHLWFNALNTTPLDRVKVVILGQDPYPTAGHAHGLSFSVLPEVSPLPKSLLNINKELLSDLQIDNSYTGNLHAWAQLGMMTFPVFANDKQDIASILAQSEIPDGVVFELLGSENGRYLPNALSKIESYTAQLKKKYPEIEIAVVAHGAEQFELTKNNSQKHSNTHRQVQRITSEDITVHICETHASWRGIEASDFPEYITV